MIVLKTFNNAYSKSKIITQNVLLKHKAKMEEFLKKLFDTNIKLSLLLLEAKGIAAQYDDKELSNFIEKEINGYKLEDSLPDYRKIKGQIVVDIYDIYGELIHKEYSIDFSSLSKQVGFDLDDLYIFDGISFIEASLGGITGKNAIKPIPKQLVSMLDEAFHSTNRHLHIVAAYHKIPTPILAYIPIVIRQNVIQHFQNINRKLLKAKSEISVEKPFKEDRLSSRQIKVFVSYAWEEEDHNSKVISFVNFLRQNGFDASMDKRKSQEQTATNFNQMMIDSIQNSDKVIIVLSKKYKEKSDKFEGGVWQELNIIIEDIKQKKNKYIFVHFGNEERSKVTPTAILGLDVMDLKRDQDENQFNSLFAKVKEENIIEFIEVSEQEIVVKKIEIKPFKL